MYNNYMRYFISGHGWLTSEQFNLYYVPVLERILALDADPKFVVGDFKGVDTFAQHYLAYKGLAEKVTVYHMFSKPRHIADKMHMNTVGGFKSDEERDAAMTAASDFDIAFVFRDNSGTEKNIMRRHRRKLS